MTELDGSWNVKRLGGLLPPLVGVRKRIHGGRGETTIGRLPGAPFDVVGLELRYRAPLRDFVDVLEPQAAGYVGRATFRGRTFGRFALERVSNRGGDPMSDLNEQLTKHIDEALAMEQNVLRMLDGMIATTEDEEIVSELRSHKLETEQHAARLRERLEAHGATPSMMREATGLMGALMKSVVDMVRQEKAGRNARDGYATEHLEIAAYQLLERIAERAGDNETADVARQNRADEETFAKTIEASWDRFAELSLKEEGVTA
ncbi:MAG: ferritin-like domain-containing protein [Gaiellaceae bacterium]